MLEILHNLWRTAILGTNVTIQINDTKQTKRREEKQDSRYSFASHSENATVADNGPVVSDVLCQIHAEKSKKTNLRAEH